MTKKKTAKKVKTDEKSILNPGPSMAKLLEEFRKGKGKKTTKKTADDEYYDHYPHAKRSAGTEEVQISTKQLAIQKFSLVWPIVQKWLLPFLSGAGIFMVIWIVKPLIILSTGNSISAPFTMSEFPLGYSWVLSFSPIIFSWWVDIVIGSIFTGGVVTFLVVRKASHSGFIGSSVIVGIVLGAILLGLSYIVNGWILLLLPSLLLILILSWSIIAIDEDGRRWEKENYHSVLNIGIVTGLATGFVPGIVFGSTYFLIIGLSLALSYLIIYLLIMVIVIPVRKDFS